MASMGWAYGYQGGRLPPMSSSLLTETFIDRAAQKAEPAPPMLPPPPPPRPAKVAPSFQPIHLALCTEGLGSESSGDIDLSDLSDDVALSDLKEDDDNDDDAGVELGRPPQCKRKHRERSARPAFPPPISLIGAGGKPWLYLRPQREDGRLVLREVVIPSRELISGRREDGRFKLHISQPETDDDDEEPAHTQPEQVPADPSTAPHKTQKGNEYEYHRVLDFGSVV